MRLHRFFVDVRNHKLEHEFWLRDSNIIYQWQKVLRFRPGQEVVLFDGENYERLYKIVEFADDGVHLEKVTDMVRKLPKRDVYLAWSLLKKDKNDWVLQKCTELGVNHFIPLITDRCEKTGFNEERAKKIVIEAAEQCGRGNIPSLREPVGLEKIFTEFENMPIYICDQEGKKQIELSGSVVLCIGPEGGWSDAEKALFKQRDVKLINLGDFTHRAETASVVASSKLL